MPLLWPRPYVPPPRGGIVQLMPSYYQQGNLRAAPRLSLLGAPLHPGYTVEPWIRAGKTYEEWRAAGNPLPMPDLYRRVATVQTVAAVVTTPAEQLTAQPSTNGVTVVASEAVEPSLLDKARAWLDAETVIAGNSVKNLYLAAGAGLAVYLISRRKK